MPNKDHYRLWHGSIAIGQWVLPLGFSVAIGLISLYIYLQGAP